MIAADPTQFTDDVYRNKRVVVAKRCGLKACGVIGKFWVQTKERFTADYKTQKAENERLRLSICREADKIADLLQSSSEAVERRLVAEKKAEPGYTAPTPPPPKPKTPRTKKPTTTKPTTRQPFPPFDPAKCDSFTIGETFTDINNTQREGNQ